MSIPEMKDIKRKDISKEVMLDKAIKVRAFKDVSSKIKSVTSTECFNDKDRRKKPDRVGITIYYPNKEAPTHFLARTFPIAIGEKEFERQIIKLEKELLKKAGK